MMNDREKPYLVSNLILAMILALLIISFSVVFTLNFRPLYYFDIDYLGIPESSGLSKEIIKENYDALIDYNSIFHSGRLEFPSLIMSESGEVHFVEVKNIFVAVQILFVLTLILSIAGIIYMRRQKDFQYLKYTAILTLAIPAVLGAVIGLNWEKSFVIFHQIFFNNDYWIFDAVTDPVITILPDTFFFHCAILILLIVLLGSGLCYFFFRRYKKRTG